MPALPSQWGRIIGSREFNASLFLLKNLFKLHPKQAHTLNTSYPQPTVDNSTFMAVYPKHLVIPMVSCGHFFNTCL
ncbi:hypothetical protein ATS71_07580 [Pseudoalteromonas sp. H71]|nr:hypothetical protein ATS71_07580 [Pseudoalteromonas sp. H71]